MKHLLHTTIAAVLLVGCGESQESAPAPETPPAEPVDEVQEQPPSPIEKLKEMFIESRGNRRPPPQTRRQDGA